ncbi:hypothetical protein NQX30_01330 [Candidatus Persebacteraceae bacterium Df01]|jgi:hypothetical protein|uniref:Uncharacterized protein n=1 Tax=Candidatus Doriopsillibacter californiensis TaxID=2970740 RepID=A0ABT7QJZ2_9GAMM|nr:hypothetical protein [Candidatus Persebacteraceae bacterium Df01]
MKINNVALPNTINYDDFAAAVSFEEMQVPMTEEANDRYLRHADSLKACGSDCTPNHGLGELLTSLVVRKHSNH